jgi:G3E family GTPase
MLAHTITLTDPDWPAISLWLSGLLHTHGDHILRIKGVIRSPAGRLLIQTVRRSVQPPEILPEGAGVDDSLAFIGHSFDPQALDASLQRFLAG